MKILEGLTSKEIYVKSLNGMRNMTSEEFACFLINIVPKLIQFSRTPYLAEFLFFLSKIQSLPLNDFDEYVSKSIVHVDDNVLIPKKTDEGENEKKDS